MKIILILLFMNNAAAALFESDDRADIATIENTQIQELGRSVPALILKKDLKKNKDGSFQSLGKDLVEDLLFCEDQKFALTQKAVAACTAFYLGDNRVATAGHCFAKDRASDYYLVFDYKADSRGVMTKTIAAKNVYALKKKLIKKVFKENSGPMQDFAIAETKRPILNRSAVVLSSEGRVKIGTPLFTLGYPLGQPLKYQPGSVVTRVDPYRNSFEHQLDTFAGNSGSPIFNAHTNEVVGIHVRSSSGSWQNNPEQACNTWFQADPEVDWNQGLYLSQD